MKVAAASTYGVYSEVGKLRKVLVCAPGLAHSRLTPTNAADLLFDDVMWVENAQRDHADFVDKLRRRGIEVVELHALLAETIALGQARQWLLDRKIVANQVGVGLVDDVRAFLDALDPAELARFLIGGLAAADLPDDLLSGHLPLARERIGGCEYLMPPLPNTLYTRDTTCWLYGGLTLNPLYWPARHGETLMKAIYQFHPDFVGSRVWWGDPELQWGRSSLEGGDIMPLGNGVVLMGMSERTSRQAITQVAAALFANGAASRVIVAAMPKARSAMHLDTVFTFADHDVVTLYPAVMDGVRTFSLRPIDKPPGVEVVDERARRFVEVVAGVHGTTRVGGQTPVRLGGQLHGARGHPATADVLAAAGRRPHRAAAGASAAAEPGRHRLEQRGVVVAAGPGTG